jgi:hypothetical protein
LCQGAIDETAGMQGRSDVATLISGIGGAKKWKIFESY